ncbi:GNAT family acetyltransferase [Georgenia sp. 311]|uniref:GNAT family acetyltransferase n=1 Tax=Georgenia sp. 311 TaxID=2585134 RepID=UPI001111E22F|nr:GNAT family acetyltransferase [Georgenia sp. 311]TNC19117.1 GNAT family acetyltransferase [Georgenia sp. 311]
MQIRPLEPADYDSAVALWEAVSLTRPWNDARADLIRAMRGPDSTVLGGYEPTGTLVATAMVGHDGHRGWVYYVAVTPDLQGKGYARMLMRACEQWVRERHIPKIQLMVRAQNTGVIGFYEALGYEASDVKVLGRRFDD